MVRILVYSNEPILTIGLTRVIAADPQLELTGSASTTSELEGQLRDASPDVAVIDLTPQITAPALVRLRNLAIDAKLVLWTTSIAGDFAFRALSIGVRGVLRKTLPLEAHRQCLHVVASGELWFERRLTESFGTGKRVRLSRREGQLVTLLSRGLNNREISAELAITEGTVKVYLSHLFRKCGARNRFDMARHGQRNLGLAGNSPDSGDGLRSLLIDPLYAL